MANQTPLYDWHVSQGGRMVEFGGWDMPVQYSNITEEHHAVRKSLGFFDISHMGRLVFQGPDAEAFLQYLITNDVESMNPGQVRYGLVCNEKGGILDDVLVYRLETYWMMVVNASNREKIVAWIEKHKTNYNFNFLDETLAWGMLAIQGPDAKKLIQTYAPPAAKLKYYYGTAGMTEPGHLRVWSRTGYTGEDGWEIVAPAEDIVGILDELHNKVAPGLNLQLRPCGLGARDTLRLEAGMPLYGHELNEETDPFQAGLGWAVKLNTPKFIGRTALEHHSENSERRQRVGLELDGKRIAREGAKVLVDEQEVGVVTSGTFSPTLEKSIAMAYVNPKHHHAGVKCSVDVRGKLEMATVVALPFYQRPKK